MDIVVDELIIEEDRPEHIAKHGVKVAEAREVIEGDYVYIKGRFLTVVVGAREKKGVYGLVTARPASREERSFYSEFILQKGEKQNGKN